MITYNLKVSTNNCNYKIFVNGFPLAVETKGLALETSIPFNHLIAGDKFLLDFSLDPIKGNENLNSIVDFNCSVIADNKMIKSSKELYNYSFDSSGEVPNLRKNEIVTMDKLSYVPKWMDGEKLDLDGEELKKMNDLLFTVWNLFKRKDLISINKFFELKDITYAESYGEPLQERLKFTNSIFNSYFNRDGIFLFDLMMQYFTPKIYCMGKIICFEENTGNHPIFYLNNKRDHAIYIPTYFAKINGEIKVVL